MYEFNAKGLIGTPDIVFRKYKTVIFVNGCFWHAHEECNTFRLPKKNTEYWERKIKRNVERDKRVKQALICQGWNVITIWECMLKKRDRDKTLNDLSLLLSRIVIDRYKI